MKQFSLKEYLKNPSRKVVTRDGRPVRIVCTDAKIFYPIIALIEEYGVEHVFTYLPDGSVGSDTSSKYDLFFDEEEKAEGVEFWLARDMDGTLCMYYGYDKPHKQEDAFWFADEHPAILDPRLFPEVKGEDKEPTKVKLVIDK